MAGRSHTVGRAHVGTGEFAHEWAAFVLDECERRVEPLLTMIDRFPVGEVARRISDWKALAREGWDVTLLLAPDSRMIVALASLGGYSVEIVLPAEPSPSHAALLQTLRVKWRVDRRLAEAQ